MKRIKVLDFERTRKKQSRSGSRARKEYEINTRDKKDQLDNSASNPLKEQAIPNQSKKCVSHGA